MVDQLLEYSKRIFVEQNLIEQRKFGTNFSTSVIENLIDLQKYYFDKSYKIVLPGCDMNWHLDNGVLVKDKNLDHDRPTQVRISEKYKIHYHIIKPKFILIVYHSDHGNDYTGGILEFCDGAKIIPKKDSYIFFNSDEVHRVSRIKSGRKELTIYKFYSFY